MAPSNLGTLGGFSALDCSDFLEQPVVVGPQLVELFLHFVEHGLLGLSLGGGGLFVVGGGLASLLFRLACLHFFGVFQASFLAISSECVTCT